jgi:hypothetical protein
MFMTNIISMSTTFRGMGESPTTILTHIRQCATSIRITRTSIIGIDTERRP